MITETLVILHESKECPWSDAREYSWYTKHPVIKRVGFTYKSDSIFGGSYVRSYSKTHGKESGYIPTPVLEKLNCVYEEEKEKSVEEQVRYGQKILAQDLFNAMLRYYPEALPEVIKLLANLKARLEK